MSGLFLNFYQVDIPKKVVNIDAIDYRSYTTNEAFQALVNKYKNHTFYRNDDKILIWSKGINTEKIENTFQVAIDLSVNIKVLSRILENAIIEYFIRLDKYKLFKNKYSNTWEIISPSNILKSIEGIYVNRVVHFSACYFIKDDNLFLGFTLSTSLKYSFSWDKSEFEKHGVDIKGLKCNERIIFANKHSIKRFLDTKGVAAEYEKIINEENKNTKSYIVIDGFYKWLEKKKVEIFLPFDLKIATILKRCLPFENELVKAEIINKPKRYYYSNKKNSSGSKFYDQMVKDNQPYSLELFQNKQINLGVICPMEYQGEVESFIKKIEIKLKEYFHFNTLCFVFKKINGLDLDSYKEVLYNSELLNCNLTFVVVNEAQEKLPVNNSPYYVCKAKLIGNGIPTQDVQIETIRQSLNDFTLKNIALNIYAKLGGTAWTIEKEDKLKEELVIGIGSTVVENNQFVLGIAQVFHNDGSYLTGDCSPLSSFSSYAKNLEDHLFKTLKPHLENMKKSETFRLIFHLFKSASKEYEIKAINGLKERLVGYKFEFALVHLAYGHNFRIFNNDGKNEINQGTYIQLSKNTALLHFVKNSDLPLKIDLDKRSTFTSLFYLAKQVYWFSHLSHRSYMPSKRTVTIMYPSLMAKMTEELKKVEDWDFERLKAVSEKLWFI